MKLQRRQGKLELYLLSKSEGGLGLKDLVSLHDEAYKGHLAQGGLLLGGTVSFWHMTITKW